MRCITPEHYSQLLHFIYILARMTPAKRNDMTWIIILEVFVVI